MLYNNAQHICHKKLYSGRFFINEYSAWIIIPIIIIFTRFVSCKELFPFINV